MLKARIVRDALDNPNRYNFTRLNTFFYNKSSKDDDKEDNRILKTITKIYNLTPITKNVDVSYRWKKMIQEYAYKNPGAIKYDFINDRANVYLDIFHGQGQFINKARNYDIYPIFLFNTELDHSKKYDLILRMFSTNNFILPNTKDDLDIYMYLAMIAENFQDISLLERVPPKIMLRIVFRLKSLFMINFVISKIECYVTKLPLQQAIDYFTKTICSSIMLDVEFFTRSILIIFINYMRTYYSVLMSTEFMTIYITARRYYDKYVTDFIEEKIFLPELDYVCVLVQSFHPAEEQNHYIYLRQEIIEQIKITRNFYQTGHIIEVEDTFPVENLRVDYVETVQQNVNMEQNYVKLIWMLVNYPKRVSTYLFTLEKWQDDLNVLNLLARYGDYENVKKIVLNLKGYELHLVYFISRIFIFHNPDSEIYKMVRNFNMLFSVHAAYILHLPDLANKIMFQCKFSRSGNYVCSNTRCRKFAITYNDIKMYKYLVSLYHGSKIDIIEDFISAANLGRYNFYMFIRQYLGPDFKATNEMFLKVDKNAGFSDLALLE